MPKAVAANSVVAVNSVRHDRNATRRCKRRRPRAFATHNYDQAQACFRSIAATWGECPDPDRKPFPDLITIEPWRAFRSIAATCGECRDPDRKRLSWISRGAQATMFAEIQIDALSGGGSRQSDHDSCDCHDVPAALVRRTRSHGEPCETVALERDT